MSNGWMAIFLVLVLVAVVGVRAQSPSPAVWGRVSFTAQSFSATDAGQPVPGFTDMVVSGTLASNTVNNPDTEFRLDFRGAGYPGTLGRSNRMSVYDAYFGRRIGALRVRAGQMWLNDLGGLGSLGGALVEAGRSSTTSRLRRLRFGVFGGLEPEVLNVGYVSN